MKLAPVAIIFILLGLCASCVAPEEVTTTTDLVPICTVTLSRASVTQPTPVPTQATATLIPSTPTLTAVVQADHRFPLSKTGPYFVGKTTHKFGEEIRPGLKASITVWYPAIKPEGYTGDFLEDAAPDLSVAPYPLLLSSTETANIFAPHLASHGFIAAGVNNQWTYLTWSPQMLDYPRETLYVLDQLATQTLPGLEGMVDAENSGYLGYSFDGTNALFLSGARVDPQLYLQSSLKIPRMRTCPPGRPKRSALRPKIGTSSSPMAARQPRITRMDCGSRSATPASRP